LSKAVVAPCDRKILNHEPYKNYREERKSLSDLDEESKKGMAPSGAATVKDPKTRVQELLKETKDDRKKTALTMKAEGYNRIEISHAFKEVTGTGMGPKQWSEWEAEDKLVKEVGAVAGPVLAKEEKAWMAEVAAHFKTLSDRMQTYVIDFGVFVLETVTPQVPVDNPEEKMRKTREWLKDAVTAFNPEAMKEIKKFGFAAFLAAQELKMQISELMAWADPSNRLQAMAERALYSPNPVNSEAFNILMTELVRSIHAVPRFERGAKVDELPRIIKAYSEAAGVPEKEAESLMGEVLEEVGVGER
jgi:hypothetical protein